MIIYILMEGGVTWDAGTMAQIKEKRYVESLKEYQGNMLLVGINYDKDTKKHICVIEKYVKNG